MVFKEVGPFLPCQSMDRLPKEEATQKTKKTAAPLLFQGLIQDTPIKTNPERYPASRQSKRAINLPPPDTAKSNKFWWGAKESEPVTPNILGSKTHQKQQAAEQNHDQIAQSDVDSPGSAPVGRPR